MRWGFLLVAGLLVAGCADKAADTDAGDGDDLPAYEVPGVPTVDAKALLADHKVFVTENNERAANLPTHESARDALEAYFASYGLETYRQNFTDGIPQQNIMGIKWGTDRQNWVVVGGHYDTITDDCLADTVGGVENPCLLRKLSQGAYDDGSGTMITVHLAKAFANVTPYYTIAFVAYDGEERGTQGAQAFVEDFVIAGNSPYGPLTVRGAIDLDMVGLNWPGVMAPLNVLTNSEALYEEADAKRKAMDWPDDQWKRKDGLALGSSDYARFWERDDPPIPTIFFISDFEELGAPSPAPGSAQTMAGAYPFWHFEDTVETMTLMAGGQENLEKGFQSISDLSVHLLHALSSQPGREFDATPK